MRLFGLIALLALLAACHTGGNKPPPSGQPPTQPTTASPSPTFKPGKFRLGSLTVLSGATSCPAGQTCRIEFEVSCPGVSEAARGTFVVSNPQSSARAFVGITLGARGVGFTGVNRKFISLMNGDGFETAIISWVDSWLEAPQGEEIGPAKLACRSATAIKWLHDNLYVPLHLRASGLGACGFCLQGNSGGASQIGYSLSLYGLGSIVNAAVLSGGPPHAGMAKGCLQDKGYTYEGSSQRIMDLAYGFVGTAGPCQQHDPDFESRWVRDSVDSASGVYKFQKTRIAFVFVTGDSTVGPPHGRLYLAKLRSAKSPYVTVREVEGHAHAIDVFPQGRTALEEALMASAT